jgi:hypothetical protein
MKKYINIAFVYAMSAIACGVFYREFTKLYAYTGRTTLAFTHLHLFALGALVFLLIALFADRTDLAEQKPFRTFMVLYNIGLPFMVVMFFVRGVFQTLSAELAPAASAAISGVAGISHTLLTVALIFLFAALRRCSGKNA